MAVLPALLNSMECWLEILKVAIEKVNTSQETFYHLLNSPMTISKPGVYWFTCGMLILNMFLENFFFSLPPDSPPEGLTGFGRPTGTTTDRDGGSHVSLRTRHKFRRAI